MFRRPLRSTLFPTRRSSDLFARPRGPGTSAGGGTARSDRAFTKGGGLPRFRPARFGRSARQLSAPRRDRKSTRLNSSHLGISYAVFCLKKKKKKNITPHKQHANSSIEKRTTSIK